MSVIRLPSDQDASGRSFGPEELDALRAVLDSGTLTATKGEFTKRLEASVAELIGVEHAVACASGSAAVHVAIAGLDLEPGDEVITTSITDMGALTPILYQGAIPVFTDVDPDTMNVTAATIESSLSDRTRAIIVTHLFGNPCQMDEILALAAARGLPVIEDAAQAYLSYSKGRHVGSMGAIGCFSSQQGKHITSGEGGFVVTNDAALARRMRVFVNKAWPYGRGQPRSRVPRPQLPHHRAAERSARCVPRQARRQREDAHQQRPAVDGATRRPGRHRRSGRGTRRRPFVLALLPARGSRVVPGGPGALAQALRFYDIAAAPRYIQKPAFHCKVIAEQVTFGTSRWPFTLARPEAVDYAAEKFPGTYAGLEHALVLPWNERMTDEHIDFLATSIREAVGSLEQQ